MICALGGPSLPSGVREPFSGYPDLLWLLFKYFCKIFHLLSRNQGLRGRNVRCLRETPRMGLWVIHSTLCQAGLWIK